MWESVPVAAAATGNSLSPAGIEAYKGQQVQPVCLLSIYRNLLRLILQVLEFTFTIQFPIIKQ